MTTRDAKKQPILIVDSDSDRLELLGRMLSERGYLVATAPDGNEAVELAADIRAPLVLVSVTTPGMDGFEVCRKLKNDVETKHIPVLLLAESGAAIDRIYGLSIGAIDYVTMPPDEAELQARVSLALRLKDLQDRLHNPGEEDGLTGVLNRPTFEEEFQRECNRSRRYDSMFALVVVDLDHFKRINDEHGPLTGDRVLKEVAEVLREQTRESDYVARWGGDEFVILLPEADLPRAIGFAKKLYRTLTEREYNGHDAPVQLEVSMGVTSMQNVGGRDPGELLNLVHECLDFAKTARAGKICYHTCGQKNLVRL